MTNDTPNPSAASIRSLEQQTWWQKPLIWGSFLLLLYLLHEFFLIGFLTFLTCFVVRSLVGVLMRGMGLDPERRGVDLFLTICILLGILFTLFGLGKVFVPRVIRQGKSLVTQMKDLSAARVQNAALANTVGTMEFDRQFGTPEDPCYQKGLAEFQAAGRSGEGMYWTFPSLHSRIQSEYGVDGERAPFKKFYETLAKDAPASVPMDYAYYQKLAEAYPNGKQAFLEVVRQHDEQEDDSPAHRQYDFETAKKLEFGQQWWASSSVADWVRDHEASEGPKFFEAVVVWFEKRLGDLFRIPVQVVTALLLAVITLVQWESLKTGVANLRKTRLQPVYDEVAPGVVALGKLIGKSFEGQMIIALINACLTLIALWWIGVEYKFVLVLMVFLFSFIPVVGVVLSGVPICAIAILQPGGSLWMVLQVVFVIAIIHLVEGMILSPRILGKIGHLHPVVVIVILLVAEKFFGMWGLVLGVPVAIYILQVVILDAPIPGIYQPKRADNAGSMTSQPA